MKTLKLTCIPFLICFIIMLCLNQALLKAQEAGTCAEKLKSAETFFTKGQVDSIPDLLSECLKSGFNREEALSAYKLMIQTLLLNDKLREADSSMLSFLKSNPEYKLSPTDHSSFVYLYNSFVVRPVLMISIRAGVNVPFLTFVQEHPTSGMPGKSVYKTDAGNIFISLEAKFKISPKLEVGVGAGYSQVKFTNLVNYYDFATIQYIETQQRIEVPVSISYDLVSLGRFTPYIRGGAGVALNLSTSADASLNMTDKNNPYSRPGQTLNVKDSRIPVDIFGLAGAGVKFKIPRGFLFLEAKGSFGFLEQFKPGGKNTSLLQNYYFWSDPDFRLNTFNLSLGYTYIFYKPSKKMAH
ncbi:MAG: outer membrane beta-barrel protein [Bacteroidales bacterium]|jgi:hypothetical protein